MIKYHTSSSLFIIIIILWFSSIAVHMDAPVCEAFDKQYIINTVMQ